MAVTTWDVPVEFEYETTRERRVLRTPSSYGFVARRQVAPQAAELRSWRLVWKNATDATVVRLRQMWSLAKGGAETITYTPIDDGAAVPVRFDGNGLVVQRNGAMMHTVRVDLVEERI